jgi:2OG-Fe(II) oxygenase superfamily
METSIKLMRFLMLEDFKSQLKSNNLVFEEVTEDILWIKDFLTKEEIDFVWNIINNSSQPDWEVEYLGNLKNFCLEKFGRDDVENLVAEGKFEITQNWADKNLNINHHKEQNVFYERLAEMIRNSYPSLELSGLATIQRMQPGVELKSHTDQHTDPSIHYATIIYINDDYVAGELFFNNLDISLRPKPGDMLFFPGNEKHEHGVRHVGEGPIRYVIVGFVKEKGHYEKNRY